MIETRIMVLFMLMLMLLSSNVGVGIGRRNILPMPSLVQALSRGYISKASIPGICYACIPSLEVLENDTSRAFVSSVGSEIYCRI